MQNHWSSCGASWDHGLSDDHFAKSSINSDFWHQEELENFQARYKLQLVCDAQRYDIHLTQSQVDLLLAHLWLVLRASRSLNLTALTDPQEALIKHIVDSLLFSQAFPQHPVFAIDLGTGAGYPGIVLRIVTSSSMVLLDSVKKKMVACQEIIDCLGLSRVTCVAERAESYALDHARKFDVVTARALASLDVLLEYGEPLLKMGGLLIVGKGSLGTQEDLQGSSVADLLGFRCVSRETYLLPHGKGNRELLVFQKEHESSVKLPRPVGRAKKRPLSQGKARGSKTKRFT